MLKDLPSLNSILELLRSRPIWHILEETRLRTLLTQMFKRCKYYTAVLPKTMHSEEDNVQKIKYYSLVFRQNMDF